MTRVQQLDAIVSQFDLNGHPFYQEWRMGTLPMEKLRDYAAEYGRFVATIAEGWDTIGFPHYAEEEREHEAMWQNFRNGIGATEQPNVPTTEVLVTAARGLFADKATAVGALYAFEAQQPNTSRSKLDGLNEHYKLGEVEKEYFVVHADDIHEAEDLRKCAEAMTEEEFQRTKTACAVVCAAMWGALDGVYYSRQAVSA